jgi:hypothetical protein
VEFLRFKMAMIPVISKANPCSQGRTLPEGERNRRRAAARRTERCQVFRGAKP